MPNGGYDSFFPYPLDKEDIVYLQKGVQSIFQEMYGMNSTLWNGQRYMNTVTSYSKTHAPNCTSSEHNYHIESSSPAHDSRQHFKTSSLHKNKAPSSQGHSSSQQFNDSKFENFSLESRTHYINENVCKSKITSTVHNNSPEKICPRDTLSERENLHSESRSHHRNGGLYKSKDIPIAESHNSEEMFRDTSSERDCNKPESRPHHQNGNVFKNENVPISKSHPPDKLFNDIIERGIDNEDMTFLKKSFYMLLWDDEDSSWARQLQWISHPTTSNDISSSQPEHSEGSVRSSKNRSGSARTEGYVKRVQKYSKMQATYKCQEIEPAINGRALPYSKIYKGNKQTLSRDARNDQRRLSTAYQTITHSNLLNLNELKFRKKKLKLGKSEIHGLGLFASEPIGPNEIIIEYVGQIIRPVIADIREKEYKKCGLGYYCFLIDDGTVVDATKYGNVNRYINHSCNPNSYAKILVINNRKKIVIYSKKHIQVNEEITYDYKMKIEEEKIECLCKAPGCRKYLN